MTPACDKPIWVLLPDSASSPRWETDDRRYFDEAFTDAGVEHKIVNAEGDADDAAVPGRAGDRGRRRRDHAHQPRHGLGRRRSSTWPRRPASR